MSLSGTEELKASVREIQSRLRTVESEIRDCSSGLTGSEMSALRVSPASPEHLKRLEAVRQRILSEKKSVEDQIQGLEDSVRRLQLWLTVESVGGISIAALVKGSVYLSIMFFQGVPFIFWYSLLILAAVVFLPFLVSTLLKLKHYNWIWILLIMVGLPASLNIIPITDEYFSLAFQLFPLLMFYAYCGILRWAVEGWLEY